MPRMCRYEPPNKGLVGACCPFGARRWLRVLIDHRRIRFRVRLDPFRRRWGLHLARTLLDLPADGLQRRRDAFGKGVAALGRPFLHLRLHRMLPEGEVHHHLATALAAVRDREPPRVVASGLGAPLHPALPLVHGEVALGVEGAALILPRVLERRPDPLAGDALDRGSLHRGGHHGGQVLRQVGNVREPSEDLFGRGVYCLALLVLLGHGSLPSVVRPARAMLPSARGYYAIGLTEGALRAEEPYRGLPLHQARRRTFDEDCVTLSKRDCIRAR